VHGSEIREFGYIGNAFQENGMLVFRSERRGSEAGVWLSAYDVPGGKLLVPLRMEG